MKSSIFTTAALLTATATAIPFNSLHPLSRRDPTPDPNSIAIVLAIAPTSNTCTNAPYPAECATATQATGPLLAAFSKYSITSPGEQIALLAWMAFESGDFKYDLNHFPAPGVPGKGTRCMMSPTYVAEYAASINVRGSDPAGILQAVIDAGADWAAASWFLTSQCSSAVRTALQTNQRSGFESFMTECVVTTMTDEREAYWTRAAQAFGLSV